VDAVITENDACNEPLASTLYERPRLLPNSYPDLEALGPLFTATECGEDRLRQLLGEKNSNAELTLDAVVILKVREDSQELRDRLNAVGFLYSQDMNGYHTRQAGTRVADLLTLQPFANRLAGDYLEDAYTAYDQDFAFRSPIDPSSALCTDKPQTPDIGGSDYPVARQYAVYDRFLGAFLTQYQCAEARRREALGETGLYFMGVNLNLKQAPSDELLVVLRNIGFTCAASDQTEESCVQWELRGAVPNERLIRLEPFTDEIKRTDCINCG
jgi:hypothetical protein